MSEEFDVVVAGGGPGGSSLAALVAKKGHRVLVLESEKFPRYQIGESLLPSTVHGICRLTGASDDIAQAGFTRKQGGTFKWGSNPEPWTFSFSVSPKVAGPTSFAYQVERMKFDQILLDNARRAGAEVREQCSVSAVLEEDGRVTGLSYTDADKNEHQIRARYVVDASGHRSRIYKAVGGTREYSEFFRNVAVFGYFEDGKRLPPPTSGNIFSVAFDSGWFWYIPLSPSMTSVGAVVRRELANKVQGNPEQVLYELIAECPLIADYLAGAKRITEGEYGKIRVRKDYSYRHTAFWRPGMVLIGDAACFVDPVFSSGVHLATYSALLAARSINSVFAGVVDEQTAFGEFETRYRREYGVFYEFLASFYEMHVDENSYFWQARKVTNSSHTELQAFATLVGGVASGEFRLDGGDALARRFAAEAKELGKAIDQQLATDARGASGQRAADGGSGQVVPMFRSAVVRQAMQESAQVQARAQLGSQFENEVPVFPGGLISSPDGLLWAVPPTP